MLIGKRIILRTVGESDLPKLYELRADIRNLGEYYPLHMPSEFLDKKRFSESGWWTDALGSLLITNHQGDILGQVNFYKASPVLNAFEIGYRIYLPENWDKGYATEAVSLFVPFLFELKPVNRIQAMIFPANVGSRRVLEKCGFTFEDSTENTPKGQNGLGQRPTSRHKTKLKRELGTRIRDFFEHASHRHTLKSLFSEESFEDSTEKRSVNPFLTKFQARFCL